MTDLRQQVLDELGGQCTCCSSTDTLTLDHFDGGGNAHRREIYPLSLEQWLIQEGYPEDTPVQLLCEPCHRSKTRYGICQIAHPYGGAMGRNQEPEASISETEEKQINPKIYGPNLVWIEARKKRSGETYSQIFNDLIKKERLGRDDRHHQAMVEAHQETIALLRELLAAGTAKHEETRDTKSDEPLPSPSPYAWRDPQPSSDDDVNHTASALPSRTRWTPWRR